MLQLLDDTWKLNYIVLSIFSHIFQGSIQISQTEARRCFYLSEDQIWLNFRRLSWIRGFPERQLRIYASSYTKNRVWVFAYKIILGQHFFHHSCSTVWYLWWCSSSHWWRCLDYLMLKVFRMHKLRGSFGHMKRMHCWHSKYLLWFDLMLEITWSWLYKSFLQCDEKVMLIPML